MKKSYTIPIIFILLILVLIQFIQNRSLRIKVKNQEQEILASSNYIEKLNSQLREYQEYSTEKSKEEKLKDLLDDYLSQLDKNEDSALDVDSGYIAHHPDRLERKDLFVPDWLPVSGQYYISQSYSGKHKGLDFAASLGTEVVAAGAGVVNSVAEDKYFGIIIEIDHLNGYLTRYAHLAKVFVRPDELINKGAVIALVGDTGNSSAPHLHFEILKNLDYLDPELFLAINHK